MFVTDENKDLANRLLWLCAEYGLPVSFIPGATVIIPISKDSILEEGKEGVLSFVKSLERMGGWPQVEEQDALVQEVLGLWVEFSDHPEVLDDMLNSIAVDNKLWVHSNASTIIVAGLLWELDLVPRKYRDKEYREGKAYLQQWVGENMPWLRPLQSRAHIQNSRKRCPGSVWSWVKSLPGSQELNSLLH